MKVYGEVDVWIHILLTPALAGSELSALRPGRFTPGTRWILGSVNLRVGLDDAEKRNFSTLPGLELLSLGCPAFS
jgi:hypothetical protein